MKKKIQKYLSGEREGFSLVELIIVIAIMAILIGIVALAVIPYLEKSRVGKDQQTVDTVYSAFQSTIADQKINSNIELTISDSTVTGGNTDFNKAMSYAITGVNDVSKMPAATAGKLGSTDADIIICTFDKGTGKIEVIAAKTGEKTAVNGIKSSNQATPTTQATP